MRGEAEHRACLVEPHLSLDEIWDEHDGTIEVTFGSTGSTLMLRSTGHDAYSLFAYGYCAMLALALHDHAGYPLVLFTTSSGHSERWSGHAAVQLDSDQVLDITGRRSHAEVHGEYRTVGPAEVLTRAEFIERTVEIEYRHDPYRFVEELERFVLRDFAEYLVQEHATA